MTDISVATSSGRVKGSWRDNRAAFLGIPYAAPPVDGLRFAPPRSFAWDDVRDAGAFEGTPPQAAGPMIAGASAISEDCLHLNIWSPSVDGSKLPVLVWIYGGGFEGGTATAEHLNPLTLVDTGNLVLVSLNYRVGFLGFGALAGQVPSNLGVRDVIAALAWVHSNIAGFGGDSDNITLMGESAGGFIVGALMAAPGAQDLYRRAIMMSGAASRLVPLENTEALTRDWLAKLGVGDVDELAEQPWQSLVLAQGQVIPRDIGERNAARVNALGVTDDSDTSTGVLCCHPMQGAVSGPGADKDLLVTVTSAEISMFRRYASSEFVPGDQRALVSEVESWSVPRERAVEIVAAYAADQEAADLGLLRERLLTDWIYRLPAARLAEARRDAGIPVHIAEIREHDGSPLGHAGDLRYLFSAAGDLPTAGEKAQARALQRVVIEFAHSGHCGWEPYAGDRCTAVIAGSVTTMPGVFTSALTRWSGVPRP